MSLSSANTPTTNEVSSRLTRIRQLLGSDPARARELAAELLLEEPGNAAARLYQGIAHRLLGDPDAAVDVLQSLCREHTNAPLAHLQLGLAFRESGRTAEALQAFRHIVSVKHDYGDAWLALADLLTEAGNSSEANAAFLRYVEYSGNDPRLQEALMALQNRDFQKAEALLRETVRVQPNDVVGLCMLAEACENLQLSGDSEQQLERCLALAPGFTRARLSYAAVLLRHNKIRAALSQTQTILAEEPANSDALKLQAAVYLRMREYEPAIQIYRELLSVNRQQADVQTSLGHALRSLGQTDESLAAYRDAIRAEPSNGEAYWNIANMKTATFTDQELESMRASAGNNGLAEIDRVHFNFALGKAYEDKGDYAQSFQYYDAANRLHHQSSQFDRNDFDRYIDQHIRFFDRDFYSQRSHYGAQEADPVFIIGLPRVGSTLVEQILASHPDVEGTMELPEILAMATSLASRGTSSAATGYPDCLLSLDAFATRELGDAYLEQSRIYRKQGRPRFIDKMPENFLHTGLLLLILPHACIIDVRRHPMSSGFSLFKQHFARRRDFSYDLADIAHYYLGYTRLMAHFDEVMPGRIHRVHYESLVSDTETEIRRLLDYCNLEFHPACLEFHKNERDINTPSSEQVRSPIYASALDTWRHYETWLQPLSEVYGSLLDTYPEIPQSLLQK